MLPQPHEYELLEHCVATVLREWRSASEHGNTITLPTLQRRFERLWWDTAMERAPWSLQLRDAGLERIRQAVRSADALSP